MPVPAPSPDSRAVVTGASQGIGEALAAELAARGHNLIITARRKDVLDTMAARLTERYGVIVVVRAVDLADPQARTELADELATRDISILCANAGTATFGPVAKLDPADEKAQVQLNVLGVHDLVLAVLPGGGVGGGDVRLAPLIGALLGWLGAAHLVIGLAAGFLIGGVAAAALLVLGRAGLKSSIAYGPAMCLGAWVGIAATSRILTVLSGG